MRPLQEKLLLAVAPRLAYLYLRALRATLRLEVLHADRLEQARQDEGRYILAFWHSRFLLMPYAFPDPRIVALHSRHRDAQMLSRFLERFGVVSAWGSSSAGGVSGLREVLRRVREGYNVGLAPDGPRGPRRQVKAGVVAIARLGGLPIVPVTYSARPAMRLSSWDRMLVPAPFGRAVLAYGEPIRLDRRADDAAQERVRAKLELELTQLTDMADRRVGLAVEVP